MQKSQEKERENLILHNQPFRIKKYNNFIASLIFAILLYIISDYDKPQSNVNVIVQKSRELQIVFETTIAKQTVRFIEDIQDYMPWYQLYSKKLVKVQFQFVFHIGYKPTISEINYNETNGNIWWEGSQLQIIHQQTKISILAQQNGYINSWSATQFANVSGTKAEEIKQFAKKQTLQKLQKHNENNQLLGKVKRKILSMIQSKQQKTISKKILSYIDQNINYYLTPSSQNSLQIYNPQNQNNNRQEPYNKKEDIQKNLQNKSQNIKDVPMIQDKNRQTNNQWMKQNNKKGQKQSQNIQKKQSFENNQKIKQDSQQNNNRQKNKNVQIGESLYKNKNLEDKYNKLKQKINNKL